MIEDFGLAIPGPLQSTIINPQSGKFLEDLVHDGIEAVGDTVRSFAQLPADLQDLVHPNLRLLIGGHNDCVRSQAFDAANSYTHGLTPAV